MTWIIRAAVLLSALVVLQAPETPRARVARCWDAWRLYKEVDSPAGRTRMEWPWPGVQLSESGGAAIDGLNDVMACLAGSLDEPKNSGRRVAMALEVEVALKQSAAQGGRRVDLPLADRSAGLEYDWHR